MFYRKVLMIGKHKSFFGLLKRGGDSEIEKQKIMSHVEKTFLPTQT